MAGEPNKNKGWWVLFSMLLAAALLVALVLFAAPQLYALIMASLLSAILGWMVVVVVGAVAGYVVGLFLSWVSSSSTNKPADQQPLTQNTPDSSTLVPKPTVQENKEQPQNVPKESKQLEESWYGLDDIAQMVYESSNKAYEEKTCFFAVMPDFAGSDYEIESTADSERWKTYAEAGIDTIGAIEKILSILTQQDFPMCCLISSGLESDKEGHFIVFVLIKAKKSEKTLLVIDPFGAGHLTPTQITRLEVIKKANDLKGVIIASNSLQRDEKGVEKSCGPLSVEIARAIAQMPVEEVQKVFQKDFLKSSYVNKQTKKVGRGLCTIDIGSLLPESLKDIGSLSSEDYTQHLDHLRAQHANLQESAKQGAKEKEKEEELYLRWNAGLLSSQAQKELNKDYYGRYKQKSEENTNEEEEEKAKKQVKAKKNPKDEWKDDEDEKLTFIDQDLDDTPVRGGDISNHPSPVLASDSPITHHQEGGQPMLEAEVGRSKSQTDVPPIIYPHNNT